MVGEFLDWIRFADLYFRFWFGDRVKIDSVLPGDRLGLRVFLVDMLFSCFRS